MNLNELRQGASAALRIPQHVSLAPARARRTYIAGPMTGYPDFNHPAFNAAAAQLRAAGIAAINPADHGVVPGAVWEDYLRSDLAQLATCESIYFLPGWSKSRGALLEHHVATALGMRMLFADGAETPQTVRLRDELRERPEQHGVDTPDPVTFARLAIDYSHNFATAKPDIGETEKEHILGLCKVVESLVEALAATGKQQVGEVQENAARYQRLFLAAVEMLTQISLRLGLEPNDDGVQPMLDAIDALAARQPGGQDVVPYREALIQLHHAYDSGRKGLGYTRQVEALDDAIIAALPAHGVDSGHARAIELLLSVADAAYTLADNSNDMEDCENIEHADFVALSDALDALDELPDNQPGYTMSEPAKARWALRALIDVQAVQS